MIYVHVPFCRSFCTYCDFYSHIPCKGRDDAEFRSWADGVICEAEARREEISASADSLNTLYFGGGTPSVLPLPLLSRVAQALSGAAGRPFREFTFEVNPEDIVQAGPSYVEGLLKLGVNRFSMGVQSLDDGILRWMNRRHDASRAEQAFHILRDAGAGNISVDVIFGVSGMGDDVLQRTLDGLLGWGPEHVSAYQLSVGEDSALAGLVRSGRYEEMADEDCAGQYGLMCRVLSEAGFSHYEISNWALPGREALHNSGYWKRLPYVGLGPGAHSFRILPGGVQRRSWNMDEPAGDAASVASSAAVAHVAPAANPVPLAQEGSAAPWLSESEDLSPEDIRVETVMLALRTAEGIPETALRTCCDPAVVDSMLSSGLLTRLPDPSSSASAVPSAAPVPFAAAVPSAALASSAAPSSAITLPPAHFTDPADPPGTRIRIPEDRFFVSESIIRDLL